MIRLLYLLQIYNNKIHVVRHLISLLYLLQIYNKIYAVRDSIIQIYNRIHVVRDSIRSDVR